MEPSGANFNLCQSEGTSRRESLHSQVTRQNPVPKKHLRLKKRFTQNNISWECTHPQAIQDVDVCFFIRIDLEKFCITSLADQWILYSEWVPSEWESQQLIKTWQKSTRLQSINYVLWNENLSVDHLLWISLNALTMASKWCHATFLIDLHLRWPQGEYIFIFGWTIPDILFDGNNYQHHTH